MNVLKELEIFKRITFEEKTHSYFIDGLPSGAPSTTQLLKKFKKPFETESVAARVARRTGLTVETLKEEWRRSNVYSTVIGNMLHKHIENFYREDKTPFECDMSGLGFDEKKRIVKNFPILVEQFNVFARDYEQYRCLGNEIRLGDISDTRICGTCDMLVIDEHTGDIEIWDFKTNKKMLEKSPYGKLLYPFEDWSEGQINEYTIQLNTYKYFIEKHTNLKIKGMKLIWFNQVNEKYKLFPLKTIQNRIEKMFHKFKSDSFCLT